MTLPRLHRQGVDLVGALAMDRYPGPALLAVRDAATALFGRWTPGTRDATYRLLKAGKLASVRDGRKWWIPAEEIDRIRNMKGSAENVSNETENA
jgi:hypothetical protein